MTWSYSGNPGASPKDAVRFACGDTEEAYAFLQDEEIEYLLGGVGNDPRKAAIQACEQILAKLAKKVDYTIGPESVKLSQRYRQYAQLYNRLKGEFAASSAVPSWDDPTTRPHTHRPIFDIGMHDGGGKQYGSAD